LCSQSEIFEDATKGKRRNRGKRSHKTSSKSKSGKGQSYKSGKSKKSRSRHSSKSKSKDSKSSKTGKSQKKSALPKDLSGSGSSKSSMHSNSRSVSTSQGELLQGGREDAADSKKDMRMEPVELRWGVKGGVQRVFIKNPTNERRAIKVKCSDNNLYRVNPVYSFIEPGQVLAVDVLRHLGEPKVDKMVFVTSKVAYTVQVSFTIHHEIGNKTKLSSICRHYFATTLQASAEDERPRDLFESGEAKPLMVLPLIAVKE
uniref:Major sperm protein n=1 Tax=Ascaris lumbricoides TaxID=6252 RepID=A0A0M3HQ39_ASCLU